MNNPTEDEKKAIAKARKRERDQARYATDPAYRERKRKRERERQRGRKRDAAAMERRRERERERYRMDPVLRERHRQRQRDPVVMERKRERYRMDPDRERRLERNRDRKYGLAPGQWDAEFDRLRGICPINGVRMLRKAPADGSRPANLAVTDHDHGTNRFRGIICNECNKNLTKAWCKRWVLRAAEAYLAKAGQDPDAPTQGTLL